MQASRMGVRAVLAILALGGAVASGGTVEDLEKGVLAHPTSDQPTWELAKAYRESGDAQRAVQFFARFHEANKPNSQSLVWQGSFKASLAAKAADMETRMNLLQSGISDMDRAVRLFGDDVLTRTVRGITLSRFPAFLQMYGRAIDDLEASLRQPQALSPALQITVREGLAQAYRQAGRTAEADAMLKSASAR
jgi:lipopolysaccharide biosynthesis regulator YciM